jgi:hypothetical protein
MGSVRRFPGAKEPTPREKTGGSRAEKDTVHKDQA